MGNVLQFHRNQLIIERLDASVNRTHRPQAASSPPAPATKIEHARQRTDRHFDQVTAGSKIPNRVLSPDSSSAPLTAHPRRGGDRLGLTSARSGAGGATSRGARARRRPWRALPGMAPAVPRTARRASG